MAVHRLVDGVVENFPDEVVQPSRANAPDIHAGTLAYGLKPFQNGDVFRGVVPGCHVYNVRLVTRLFVCLTIVAVFPLHLAAATAVSEDVPVPGGLAAFARTLGIDPVPDRGRFMYDVTRLLFDNDPQRSPERLALRFGLTPGAIKVIFERSN